MIREEDVERHLDALAKVGPAAAIARADAEFASDMIRTVYAAEFLQADLPRAADKEAAALSSPAYRAALEEKRRTMIEAEKLRHERAWRERCIEAWQTMSANARGKL